MIRQARTDDIADVCETNLPAVARGQEAALVAELLQCLHDKLARVAGEIEPRTDVAKIKRRKRQDEAEKVASDALTAIARLTGWSRNKIRAANGRTPADRDLLRARAAACALAHAHGAALAGIARFYRLDHSTVRYSISNTAQHPDAQELLQRYERQAT